MKRITDVTQALTGGFFLLAGALKLAHAGPDVAVFARAGLPGWSLSVAGLVNAAGGAGMLRGFRRPDLAAPSGLLLTAYLLFAIRVALRNEDPRDATRLTVLLALCAAVTGARLPDPSTPCPATPSAFKGATPRSSAR